MMKKRTFPISAILLLLLSNVAVARTPISLEPDLLGRVRTTKDESAIKAIPAGYKFANPGEFTVGISPWEPPVITYALDSKTLIGSDPDLALLVADSFGLKLKVVNVSWEDWPLGLVSGKYDAVISNITVTEERKEKFDFSTYRQDVLGFYVKTSSTIKSIQTPKDIAGLKIITDAGTNQEKILLEWDKKNREAGLKPVEIQYYDDRATSNLALQSGRADVEFSTNATRSFEASQQNKIRLVGTVNGGWPLTAEIAVATRKGSGLSNAVTVAINNLIKNGKYSQVFDFWGQNKEIINQSSTNPPGLPKTD